MKPNNEKRKEMNIRIQKELSDMEIHKQHLAKEYGVLNNPKLDRLYELAWSFGHSCGFNEVETYFAEMVDLIR